LVGGGTVHCIDQVGGFGVPATTTITQSVTIDCKAVGGDVNRFSQSGEDTGFVINGAGINVTLRGLNITGLDDRPGRIGIDIQQAGSVHIEDCTIHNFGSGPAQGIHIAPSSGFTSVAIEDTVISDNGLGIRVVPGASGALVSLLRVRMYNNASGAFQASGATGASFTSIVDSIANLNGTHGFVATTPAGGQAVVLDIQHSVANLNQQSGILADGAAARITIGTSTVAANGTGFARTNGGAIVSHGNNNVDDNTANGSPSGTAAQM
jgi:hypothetical protein